MRGLTKEWTDGGHGGWASHAAEIPWVFGDAPPCYRNATEQRLTDTMQAFWTSFAKTGQPAAAAVGNAAGRSMAEESGGDAETVDANHQRLVDRCDWCSRLLTLAHGLDSSLSLWLGSWVAWGGASEEEGNVMVLGADIHLEKHHKEADCLLMVGSLGCGAPPPPPM